MLAETANIGLNLSFIQNCFVFRMQKFSEIVKIGDYFVNIVENSTIPKCFLELHFS